MVKHSLYSMKGELPMQEISASANASIHLKNRETAVLSGVEDVLAFDDTAITLRTTLGELVIEGSSLRITDFCAERGDLSVFGKISVLAYEDKKEKRRSSLFRPFSK